MVLVKKILQYHRNVVCKELFEEKGVKILFYLKLLQCHVSPKRKMRPPKWIKARERNFRKDARRKERPFFNSALIFISR